MKSKPVLSICIPTFNRAAKLDNILGIIYGEISGLHGEVQVCVSDNGSKDATQRIISKWKKRLPLKSRRNTVNMGYDINAAKVMEIADGEFAMYSGDDDSLVKGSIRRLVADLKANFGEGIGAVYLNSLKNGSPVTKFGFSEFKLIPCSSRDYPPISITFDGAVCLRTKYAKSVLRKKLYVKNGKLFKLESDPFLLFDFVHTYLFLECAKDAGSFGIEPSCIIEVMGRGASISIQKRFYFEIVFNLYYLQVRQSYPWVKEALFNDEGGIEARILRRHIALSYMAIKHPKLSGMFLSNFGLCVEILETERKPLFLALLKLMETARRTGVFNWPLAFAIDSYKSVSGRKDFLSEQPDTVGTPAKAVDDLIARASKYQKKAL